MRPYESTNYPLAPIYSVARIQLGKMLQPEPRTSADKPIRYLRSASIQDGYVDYSHATTMWASPSEAAGLCIQDHDLLVSEGGDVGRVAMVTGQPNEPTIFQNSVLRLDTNPKNDARFLFYALQGLYKEHDYYEVVCTGSTIRHLTAEKLAVLRVPSPPLGVQRRIADFLDAQVTLIDRAIQLRQQQIALAEEAFGVSLSHIYTPSQGSASAPLQHLLRQPPCYGVLVPSLLDEGVPFIRINDLGLVSDGQSPRAFISKAQSSEYKRTIVSEGDVLTSVVGTLGTAAIVGPQQAGANIARAVCRLQPVAGVPSWFLYGWLNSAEFMSQARLATGSGTAQATLNMGDLRHFSVGLGMETNLRQQADQVRELFRSRNREKHLLDKSTALIRERKQALITAAVSGEFDVSTARVVSV